MIHANTKIKIRNAIDLMSRKRGYFNATEIISQFSLEPLLLRVLKQHKIISCRPGKSFGSKYIGAKPCSETELNDIYLSYYKETAAKRLVKKRNTNQRNVQFVHTNNMRPAPQPQKNRVRLLWGLIDFTY